MSYILLLLSITTAYYNEPNITNCSKLKYCSHALQTVHPKHKESLTAVLFYFCVLYTNQEKKNFAVDIISTFEIPYNIVKCNLRCQQKHK